MDNIEEWFFLGTGLKLKELRYLRPPPLPYLLYIDSKNVRGADEFNNIIEHNVTIEFYSEKVDEENERKIRRFLNSEEIQFEENRDWINSEKLFCTSYDFFILEKERKKEYE